MKNLNPPSSLILMVVALMCEARPLIEYFKLKKQTHICEFPVFTNKTRTIFLIISGVGKINAANAVGFLCGITQQIKHAIFFNIGIAGSEQYQIGDLIIAHKIVDQASQNSSYPSLLFPKKYKTDYLLTVDQPMDNYLRTPLVDMEASGFFNAAIRFVVREQIQVIKIISDNPKNSYQGLNAKKVSDLIENKLDLINELTIFYSKISEDEARINLPPVGYDDIINYCHFTAYQRHELHALLRRYTIIFPQENPFLKISDKIQASKIIIMFKELLNQEINL